MDAPVGTWTIVLDLTDPLDVEDKPVTFRTLDAASFQSHLRPFRAATIERTGRTGLRIRAKIDAASPREASDQLWLAIEKVFYPDSARPQFGSINVRMSVTPAMNSTT